LTEKEYIEEWEILAVYDFEDKLLVDFAFYLPNGEFDEIDVCGFPLRETEKWKNLIGKRIKVRCSFDENGDRILEAIKKD